MSKRLRPVYQVNKDAAWHRLFASAAPCANCGATPARTYIAEKEAQAPICVACFRDPRLVKRALRSVGPRLTEAGATVLRLEEQLKLANTRASSLKRERELHKAQADSIAVEMQGCLAKLKWVREQLERIHAESAPVVPAPSTSFVKLRGGVDGLAMELRRFLGEPPAAIHDLAKSDGLRVALGLPLAVEDVPGPTCHLGKAAS